MPNYAFIDTAAHPAAITYYNTFREEPTGPIQNMSGLTAEAMPGMTLDELLDGVVRCRPEGFLMVSHGRDGGLSLPFDRSGSRAHADHIALGVLAATSSVTVGGMTVAARSDVQAARELGITEALVARLRAKMRQVQALPIQHVALRACNAGRHPDLLSIARRFFDADGVSAPGAQDCYGILNPQRPSSDVRAWQAWERAHRGHWVDGTHPSKVAYRIVINDRTHTFDAAFMADSYAAISGWIGAQFPRTASPDPHRSFPIHAIRDDRGPQFPPFAFPGTLRYRQLVARDG